MTQGEAIERRQRALRQVGFYAGELDGIAGPLTREAISRYLSTTQVRGPLLDAALEAELGRAALPGFGGWLGALVALEERVGRPYWPRYASGVTLDFGVDLRFLDESGLRRIYGDLLTEADYDALSVCFGAGPALAAQLVDDPRVSRVRIAAAAAGRALPRAATHYWAEVRRVWPEADGAPAGPQTAVLCWCYNAWSQGLWVVRDDLRMGRWDRVAAHLDRLAAARPGGIGKRRAAEARLCRMI